jgi:hypothetical protein
MRTSLPRQRLFELDHGPASFADAAGTVFPGPIPEAPNGVFLNVGGSFFGCEDSFCVSRKNGSVLRTHFAIRGLRELRSPVGVIAKQYVKNTYYKRLITESIR